MVKLRAPCLELSKNTFVNQENTVSLQQLINL